MRIGSVAVRSSTCTTPIGEQGGTDGELARPIEPRLKATRKMKLQC